MKNGYDRYLDYQFRESGNFFKYLFDAITFAGHKNTDKLRLGFPEEVDAYLTWTRKGCDAFLKKCTPGNPMIDRMKAER